jgi:hypothetical protein
MAPSSWAINFPEADFRSMESLKADERHTYAFVGGPGEFSLPRIVGPSGLTAVPSWRINHTQSL